MQIDLDTVRLCGVHHWQRWGEGLLYPIGRERGGHVTQMMQWMPMVRILAVVLGGLVGWLSILPVEAADFVVKSAIYASQGERPVAENRTYFVGDLVVDELIGEPAEVSVLDLGHQSIELLSVGRRVKTTLTFNELSQFVAAMKVEALQTKSHLARFAAAPHFEILQHEDPHQFRLKSEWMEYQVHTQACDEEITQQYKRFCDWYARLNATRVGALPPHARLDLNSQLALQPRFPTRIQLTIRNEKTATELTSRHELQTELTGDDRQRVAQIELDRQQFTEVSLADFRGIKLQAAR